MAENLNFKRVEDAIAAISRGEMIIMTDDCKRENEGDLVFAASDVNAEKINFMAKHARGLICLALAPEKVDCLKLPMMNDFGKASPKMGTAFTVSIEAREGVSTGISAADRARTIQVAIDPKSGPEDLVVPGHVFPLKARAGGVLERAGHTEGGVDLALLAGKSPAAVICEIMKDDGTMARFADLEAFAASHGNIPILPIVDLIRFRLAKETLVEEVRRIPMLTVAGAFTGIYFRNRLDGLHHFCLAKGLDWDGGRKSFVNGTVVDVRVQKQEAIFDTFSLEHRSRNGLDYGLKMLAKSEAGVFLYLNPGPASILGGISKEEGSDSRMFGIGAQMLKNLGVESMRVHLRKQRNFFGLEGFGLKIEQVVPFE